MRTNNTKTQVTGQDRYIVIGETGSIYLGRENRYPEKGEVIELSKARADALLSSNLIAPFVDAQEITKE